MKKTLLIFVCAVAVACAGYAYWQTQGKLVSSRAVVEGKLVPVSAVVDGNVAEVFVAAGETVSKGQILFALDKTPYEARLAKERERLAAIAASLPGDVAVPSPASDSVAAVPEKSLPVLRVEEDEARAAVETAANVFAAANIRLSRMNANASSGYASKTSPKLQAALIERDEAAFALQKTKAAFEAASGARAKREAQEKIPASGGAVSGAVAARIAEYQAQISRVRFAEQAVESTVARAPENGRVLIQSAQPGVMVAAGAAPVMLVPEKSRGIWIMAIFPKEMRDELAPDLACEISLEDVGNSFNGRVEEVLPTPEGEKDVAVRVILDQYEDQSLASPGQAATVTVFTGKKLAVPGVKHD